MARRKNSTAKEIDSSMHPIEQLSIARHGTLSALADIEHALGGLRNSKDLEEGSSEMHREIVARAIEQAIRKGDLVFFKALADMAQKVIAGSAPASPIEHCLAELRLWQIVDGSKPMTETSLRRYVMEKTGTEFSGVTVRTAANRVGIKLTQGRPKSR